MSFSILGRFRNLKSKLYIGALGTSANVAIMGFPFLTQATQHTKLISAYGGLVGIAISSIYLTQIGSAYLEKKKVEELFDSLNIPDKEIWMKHIANMHIQGADDFYQKINLVSRNYNGLNTDNPVKKDKYIKGLLGSVMYGASVNADNMRIFPESLFCYRTYDFDRYLNALQLETIDYEVIKYFREKKVSNPMLWIDYLVHKEDLDFNEDKVRININLDLEPEDFIILLSNRSTTSELSLEGLNL